jgi:hypothetical protein
MAVDQSGRIQTAHSLYGMAEEGLFQKIAQRNM